MEQIEGCPGRQMEARILKWLIPYILISATVYSIAKNGINHGSPFLLMGIRYVLTAAVFLAISRKLLLKRSVILFALTLSSSTVLWIIGLQFVSSGESAVLSYTMPFFAIIGSALALEERATTRQVFGAIIGFSGTALFTVPLAHGFVLLGSILTIGGAVAWAAYTIYLRKLRDEDKSSVLGTAYLIGSVPFVLGSIAQHNADWAIQFIADGLYLAIFGSVIAIYLLSSIVKEERVGVVTTMIFAIPPVSLAIQVLLTSVVPSVLELLGCAIILFGVYIAGKR
jgi:drug/metabolite transporter (DMT)-like permease